MRSASLAALLLLLASAVHAQMRSPDHADARPSGVSFAEPYSEAALAALLQSENDSLPKPTSVMYKSMILPGWGQVVNRQAWKVPIVYGLIGGLAWYSVQLNLKYHDYRAAYHNLNPESPDDLQFGPTPDYIPANANLESLRNNRNTFRNRRDLMYVAVGLAYGLNIVDAYVFAHMRSFDVSEDLTMRTRLEPVRSKLAGAGPGLTLSFEFHP